MGTNILQTFGAIVPLQVGASWYEKEDRGLISGILGVTTGAGYLVFNISYYFRMYRWVLVLMGNCLNMFQLPQFSLFQVF